LAGHTPWRNLKHKVTPETPEPEPAPDDPSAPEEPEGDEDESA